MGVRRGNISVGHPGDRMVRADGKGPLKEKAVHLENPID